MLGTKIRYSVKDKDQLCNCAYVGSWWWWWWDIAMVVRWLVVVVVGSSVVCYRGSVGSWWWELAVVVELVLLLVCRIMMVVAGGCRGGGVRFYCGFVMSGNGFCCGFFYGLANREEEQHEEGRETVRERGKREKEGKKNLLKNE